MFPQKEDSSAHSIYNLTRIKMKRVIYLLFIASIVTSCSSSKFANITVTNSSTFDREKEIVEVPMKDVSKKVDLNNAQVVVLDKNGEEIPYQITFDKKIIFPVSIKAESNRKYIIKKGTPQKVSTTTCGKKYPERVDDVAWENDRIAFRTYGPALQATGEQAFGYDIWAKKSEKPVVDARYAMELDTKTLAKIEELKKTDIKAAKELRENTSYHVDHGNGLDYYKVGPTLGAGTSAFYIDNSLIYPYCYKSEEILDNGPLRFTVRLIFNTLKIKGESSTETRIISLDQGSQLNKAIISFSNINETLPLATGIVLHEGSNDYAMSAQKGYIAYADPNDSASGQIYVGAVFPNKVNTTQTVPFTGQEANKIKGGANGHVLAISNYEPNTSFTYYFGAGWSKWGFNSPSDWYKYIEQYAQKVRQPLKVSVK